MGPAANVASPNLVQALKTAAANEWKGWDASLARETYDLLEKIDSKKEQETRILIFVNYGGGIQGRPDLPPSLDSSMISRLIALSSSTDESVGDRALEILGGQSSLAGLPVPILDKVLHRRYANVQEVQEYQEKAKDALKHLKTPQARQFLARIMVEERDRERKELAERREQERKQLAEERAFKERQKMEKAFADVLRVATLASGGNMFDAVELEGETLHLFVTYNLADSIINANLRFFADTSSSFAKLCGCDGEVDVGVDTTFLGGQKRTIMRFRNGRLAQRGY